MQQPDVSGVVVLNATSTVLASAGKQAHELNTTGEINNAGYTPGNATSRLSVGKLLTKVNRDQNVFDNGQSVLIYRPILTTRVALDDFRTTRANPQVGAVIIEMSWQQTRSQKSRLLWFTVLATSVALLFAWYLAHLASRRIINPVTALSRAIHAIGAGDLDTRVDTSSHITELSRLSNGINQMTADLRHEREILQQRIAEATEQLQALAFYDTLTLLPNRRLLNDRLSHALATSHRNGHYGALMFLDLDNFKPLNDKYGHAVGDLLLIEVASRIARCLREEDTVARFGGDEFVVMLNDLDAEYAESAQQAYQVAEKIRALLAEPYQLTYLVENQTEICIEHHCSASLGIILFLGHQASQENIMHWADAAMYQAKKQGRNQIFLDDQTATK